MTFETLIYETPEPGVARIWLNRPETRNAQDTTLLRELDAAYERAMRDDSVKVVILAAKGPHFSSGHDLREEGMEAAMAVGETHTGWASGDWEGVEAFYCREKEIYEGYCRRWRDLAKPTIASVQGKAISGALMLIWPCDFVIASEDATFQDNTMFLGIPGVEWFAHAWELGIRKAKEFLLTGQPISAAEAKEAGMVNKIAPRERLEEETLAFARLLTDKRSLALRLGKQAINAAFAAQGFEAVQQAALNAHHLAHTHYRLTQNGAYLDRESLEKSGARAAPRK